MEEKWIFFTVRESSGTYFILCQNFYDNPKEGFCFFGEFIFFHTSIEVVNGQWKVEMFAWANMVSCFCWITLWEDTFVRNYIIRRVVILLHLVAICQNTGIIFGNTVFRGTVRHFGKFQVSITYNIHIWILLHYQDSGGSRAPFWRENGIIEFYKCGNLPNHIFQNSYHFDTGLWC